MNKLLQRRIRSVVVGLSAIVMALPGVALDSSELPAPAEASAARTSETWADYSMMGKRRTGQIWASGKVASQFQWVPRSATEADVYYGDPENWPPEYRERFVRDGDWVMLHGWWGNGTYYEVSVGKEELCDRDCESCTTIATSGPQHYAKWSIPAQPYCLRAEGVITEQSSGKTLRFGHTQWYGAPAPCANSYFSGQRCISQREVWWDDNATPYQRKLDRRQQLAKNLGPGFTIDQVFPASWKAELRHYSDH